MSDNRRWIHAGPGEALAQRPQPSPTLAAYVQLGEELSPWKSGTEASDA